MSVDFGDEPDFSLDDTFHDDPTRALYPRQLIIYDEQSNIWSPCEEEEIIVQTDYIAVSYRQSDFPNRDKLEESIRIVCHASGIPAYWLDYACTGATQKEKNRDLYRIADVFRGAKKTLIMVKGDEDRPLANGWQSWGNRIWTLPEALLSQELIYKVGTRFIKGITLRRVANMAYKDRYEEMMLIEGYSGKDPLSLVERIELLRKAIWKRSSGVDKKVSVPGTSSSGGVFTSYPGERVYALMGFCPRRIRPNRHDSEEEAFRKLKIANGLGDHLFSWEIEAPPQITPAPEGFQSPPRLLSPHSSV